MPRLAGLALAVAAATLAACSAPVVGSGDITASTPPIEPFEALSVESAFVVRLAPGDYGIQVRADDNVLDRVRAEVSRGTLVLSLDGSVSSATLEADVTLPAQELAEVRVRGASTVRAEETLSASALTVEVQGASTVAMPVVADALEVSAEGASTITMTGTASSLQAQALGASTLHLFGLTAGEATVVAEGASTVAVSVTTSLDAAASGASTIRYDGSPGEVLGEATGASSVGPR